MKKIRVLVGMNQQELFVIDIANYLMAECFISQKFALATAKKVPVMALDYTPEKDKYGRHRLVVNEQLRCFALGIKAFEDVKREIKYEK